MGSRARIRDFGGAVRQPEVEALLGSRERTPGEPWAERGQLGSRALIRDFGGAVCAKVERDRGGMTISPIMSLAAVAKVHPLL